MVAKVAHLVEVLSADSQTRHCDLPEYVVRAAAGQAPSLQAARESGESRSPEPEKGSEVANQARGSSPDGSVEGERSGAASR